MIEYSGGHLRRNGAAVAIAAAILTAGAAAVASAATAPSLTATERADVRAAVLTKTTGGVRSRLAAGLAALSTPAVRTAPRAEQARRLSLPVSGPGSLQREGSDVVVNVRTQTTSPGQVEALRSAGARVLNVSGELRTVTVAVAPAALEALAAVAGVEVVTPELRPLTSGLGSGAVTSAVPPCGSVTSEADQQLRAALARDLFGVDGTGVKVGVLSDSYDVDNGDATDAADDVATGDLPGGGNPCGHLTPVQVLNQGSGNDEGRAMLEVVHDLAPGATLAFNAAGLSGQFPGRVDALRTAGARVIVDDISYFEEPYFQDGPHAVAANTASANGSAYYSSAANSNVIVDGVDRASWEAPSYRPLNCGAPAPYIDCMNFGTAANPAIFQQFHVAPGGSLVIDFQWAQPWSGVTTDFDAFLFDENGIQVGQGINRNTGAGTQKPLEIFGVDNNDSVTHTYRLAILKFSGAVNPRLKWTLIGSRRVSPELALAPGDVSGPSIFGHNGAPGAMSIAAVPFNNSATIEPFSSRGPVTHYFGPVNGTTPAAPIAPQVLAKPDLAATDGAQTTFFFGTTSPFRFFGTSEAAPHAAAVAALQFDAQPGANVASVEAAQKSTAAPVGSFGAVAQGAGLVDAARAVGAMVGTFIPSATTGSATGVTTSTATLNGVVNPQRATTSYHFDYGTTTAYGTTTPATGAGAGTADVGAAAPLAGLAAGTTYHFRLVASNALGSATGADGVFTTTSVGGGTPPPPPPPKPKVKVKLRGRTLTLTFSGGTFTRASVTIKKGRRTVARASGRVRANKFTIRLKKRLKKGRYSLRIVLTDNRGKKWTLRPSLKV
jgi:hypothetical protein